MTQRLHTIEDRLREYSIPEPNSGCHLWLAATDGGGYGMVWVGDRKRGAHVVAWEFANGRPVRPGLLICHRCDVRCCVNPDHLFEGTYQDNIVDAVAKGRHVPFIACGTDNYNSRFTKTEVRKMRRDGRPARVIAAEHGVNKSTVDRVRQRVTYKNA